MRRKSGQLNFYLYLKINYNLFEHIYNTGENIISRKSIGVILTLNREIRQIFKKNY